MRIKNQRFSSEEILLIKNLTNEGRSLNYLSNLLNVGKPTIYYQVRKFKPRIKKDFIIGLNDFEIGELIGAFAGDGSYCYYLKDKNNLKMGGSHRVRYHLSLRDDYQYAEYLKFLLISMNLNPHFCKRESEGTLDISMSSEEFALFIKKYLNWSGKKTYTVCLKDSIRSYSEDFIKGFVRGLMDTDGYVEVSNVGVMCVSENLIKNLRDIFDFFNIKYKFSIKIFKVKRKDGHLVRVYRDSLEKYNFLFGFSNKYKQEKLNKIFNNRKS